MRIAIATWNDRVSPVFDTSSRLLVVNVDHGVETSRCFVEVRQDSSATGRVRRLTELAVTVLICGAISRALAESVSASGVVAIPWVSGPVEGVLRAYVTKRLSDARWRMPGCRGRCRRRKTPSAPQGHSQN
jgi:predicted Fe-Mo cluster-binding NifX family protein